MLLNRTSDIQEEDETWLDQATAGDHLNKSKDTAEETEETPKTLLKIFYGLNSNIFLGNGFRVSGTCFFGMEYSLENLFFPPK